MVKCLHYIRNLDNLSDHFSCMYFFNVARHHIVFIFNTKRPISSVFFLVKCSIQKSLSEV